MSINCQSRRGSESCKYIFQLLILIFSFQLNLSADLLLKEVKLTSDNQLPVKFDIISACMFGDLDLIQKDMDNDIQRIPRTELLLTLQDIDQQKGSDFYSLVKFEVVDDFSTVDEQKKSVKNTTFELEIPFDLNSGSFLDSVKNASSDIYALKICRSTDGSKHCSNKLIRSFDENFKRHEYVKPEGSNEFKPRYPEIAEQQPVAPDLVYFFAPLIIDSGKIYIVSQPWTTATSEQLAAKFPNLSKDKISKASENMFTLENFNLDFDGSGNLVIKLLTNNPDKC